MDLLPSACICLADSVRTTLSSDAPVTSIPTLARVRNAIIYDRIPRLSGLAVSSVFSQVLVVVNIVFKYHK